MQQLILGKSLREHIGGRWAISWVAYAINVPVNFIAITTSIRTPPTGMQWWGWALVGLTGLAAIGLVFGLANVTVLRRRRQRPVSVFVVVATGTVTGVVRGVVVVWASSALELESFSAQELLNRTLAGALVGAVALPLAALVLSILTTYRDERRRLVMEKVTVERERLQQEGQISALQEALVRGVQAEVTQTLDTISIDNPRSVSEAMRTTSHRIWSGDRHDRQRSEDRVIDVLWPALTSSPVPVLPAVVLWGVTALGTLVGALGPAVGLVNWLAALVALWLCLTVANRWIRRAPGQWGWATAVMLAIAYVFISPVAYVVFDARPVESALPLMIVNAVWLPVCVALVAIAFTALASGEQVLQNLADEVKAEEINLRALEAEREEMLRELAMQLHGTAHSPLVAGSALSSDASQDARDRLLEHVGRAVAQIDLADRGRSIEDRLSSIALPWHGLVDVEIEVPSDVDSAAVSEADRRLIVRIVEEAIANAYRHGQAALVQVSIAGDAQGLVVQVADNGRGPAPDRSAGLGCRLFETASPGIWSLQPRDGGGAILLVRLAG